MVAAIGRAHPRLRGEHVFYTEDGQERPGSSPLTRGALRHLVRGVQARGLIPAYAGSTRYPPAPARSHSAHPRLRGEHCWVFLLNVRGVGSSPLTRGAQSWADWIWWSARLIPAYAGSTDSVADRFSPNWAHPRLRGEHIHPDANIAQWQGSSPLTRGALSFLLEQVVSQGLIPAYAGSTGVAFPWISTRTAHPRLRGEHEQAQKEEKAPPGSSPLTRGALVETVPAIGRRGLIPAYAGSTIPGRGHGCRAAAHPRLRGEHFIVSASFVEGAGSSPLTRGARQAPHTRRPHAGLIPAYAGSTT